MAFGGLKGTLTANAASIPNPALASGPADGHVFQCNVFQGNVFQAVCGSHVFQCNVFQQNVFQAVCGGGVGVTFNLPFIASMGKMTAR